MKQRLLERSTDANERGAALFLVTATVLIVMFAGAMALDLSHVATRGQQLQNAADSAALAGVQAYRESMGADTVADGVDEDAARQAVADILAQNGVDPSLVPQIDFPDDVGYTEVRVTIADDDPGLLLAGFTGIDAEVERTATARFERCEDDCVKEIPIPEPFRGVEAAGDGDGYKPIPVGDRLYALNHNATTLQIVCIDRTTEAHCWDTGPAKVAYPGGYAPPRNPEMPHAAVIGTTIYWSVSTSSGHWLYCWETLTDTPCPTPYLVNSRPRASALTSRIQNRGGGTLAFNDQVYVFTDDHRVHCIEPGSPMTPCVAYGSGGRANGLAEANFPPNEPADGNHGSSIDRIVNEANGFIYATIHIDNAISTGSVDCSAGPLVDPVGEEVVILNTTTGEYMAVDSTSSSDNTLTQSSNGDSPFVQWEIVDAGGGNFFIRSMANGRQVDADSGNTWSDTRLDAPGSNIDEMWYTTDFDGSSYKLQEAYWNQYRLQAYSGDIIDVNWSSGADRWEFWPYQCALTNYTPLPEPTLPYDEGTWLHCWDATAATTCAGFTPTKLHDDWDSFSGRLFFFYEAGTNPGILAVCSTGFTQHWEWDLDMSDYVELTCVDDTDGSPAPQNMPEFMTALATSTDAAEYWGTWGDPHYNEHNNRLFYPTHRKLSRVLCWDFDYGWCGSLQAVAELQPDPLLPPSQTYVQDYGFFSEENCIFGLGHNAVFYAFKGDDIYEDCTGSSRTEPITPCNCGGKLYWGSLTFDVAIELFDSFLIEIKDDDGNRVYPTDPDSPGHSLHTDGEIIDLNFVPIIDGTEQLWVTVSVEAEDDPWALGDQSFTIELERTPRLTD